MLVRTAVRRVTGAGRVRGCLVLFAAAVALPAMAEDRVWLPAERSEVTFSDRSETDPSAMVEPSSRRRPASSAVIHDQSVAGHEVIVAPMAEPGTVVSSEARACPECDASGALSSGGAPCTVCASLHGWWRFKAKPKMQACSWGYPENFCERPFGSYMRMAGQAQVVNGLRDQQVLYHYDFSTGADAALLSPRGQYQLQKIIRRMELVPGPVVVQATVDNPGLDEARRAHVLDALQSIGIEAVPEMVVIGRSPTIGLQGTEALLIYQNLLLQTQQRGTFIGGGDTGTAFSGDVGFGTGTAGQQ